MTDTQYKNRQLLGRFKSRGISYQYVAGLCGAVNAQRTKTNRTMKKIQSKKVARIFQEPTGLWYFCPDNLDHLSTDYCDGHYTESGAIRAARESGNFSHRTNRIGKRVKL